MSLTDWIVMGATMIIVIGYGIWKTRNSKNIEGFLLGGNEAKWWTVGLSVMATQASAITFLSTPGQAYNDGLGFVQFYLSLPIAMIIICVTFIPIFYRLKVYTAYEYLETRFDVKTRTLTSFLFLVQRGLATGITLYAPALILSSVMGWNLNLTTFFIGLIAIIYTVSGGTKAVHVTHRIQMIIIFIGLIIIFFLLMHNMPKEYAFDDLMSIAGAGGKLEIIDTKFDWDDRYNIWTALIAAPFLFLSYFGTDQSQVQRYISGKSIKESRLGLLMNGFAKVPLQFFILFIGLLVFLFFQFNRAPIFFNERVVERVLESEYSEDGQRVIAQYDQMFEKKKTVQADFISAEGAQKETLKLELQQLQSQEKDIRTEFKKVLTQVDATIETNDKDYIFINYILNYLPRGLVGLLFAMILFAAMSSAASELNALASTSTVDIYKRILNKSNSETHYLLASRLLTLFWGVVAICFAYLASLAENLIQFVNIIGSLFYGTILGVFLVAFYIKYVKSRAIFVAAIITQVLIIRIFFMDIVSFLWLNIIGALLVILIGLLLEMIFRGIGKKNG